jgi:hypothetical protein
MAHKIERRDFIKSAIYGVGTLFVISTPLKIFARGNQSSSDDQNTPSISTLDAIKLNVQAKELFYRKSYPEAIAIYQQLIANYPDRISYYDGYARILGAQQKTLEVAELYRQGLQTNPNAPLFMHRLSLRMNDLCLGNRKAEKTFVSKYGESQLFEAAAQPLVQAIAIKSTNKGLYLNLRDILKEVEKKNKSLDKKGLSTITFSDSLRSNIMATTASFEAKWGDSRRKHKPAFTDDVETAVEAIKNKERREMYSNQEKYLLAKAIKKAKKEHWQHGLAKNIANDNPNRVEKFGTLILEQDINDTDTIGKLRKYYRKTKARSRLLALDRYLYLKNESLANTLALAGSLCKYGDGSTDLSDAKQLLGVVAPYVNTLPPVSIGAYYQLMAQVKIAEKLHADARTILLEGLDKFMGRGGVAYSLMETYAQSFTGKKMTIGIQLLQALCAKKVDAVDDPVWKYVTNYLQANGDKISVAEQLKPLYALAKLQNKAGDTGCAITKSEINALRAKIY